MSENEVQSGPPPSEHSDASARSGSPPPLVPRCGRPATFLILAGAAGRWSSCAGEAGGEWPAPPAGQLLLVGFALAQVWSLTHFDEEPRDDAEKCMREVAARSRAAVFGFITSPILEVVELADTVVVLNPADARARCATIQRARVVTRRFREGHLDEVDTYFGVVLRRLREQSKRAYIPVVLAHKLQSMY